MKTANTPGPWRVRRRRFASNFDKTPRFTVETDGQVVCETRPVKAPQEAELGYDEPATKANAELIAASPDLLAALELALQRAECDLRMWPVADLQSVDHRSLETAAGKYRAAIAKATGGS